MYDGYTALDLALTKDRMEVVKTSNEETLSTDSENNEKKSNLGILAIIAVFLI